MTIRRAEVSDMNRINDLLFQVLNIHNDGRPDLFRRDTKKYNDGELAAIIEDDTRPIFVACDEQNCVIGYAFCVFIQHKNHNILTDIKSLYIDDLCVDEGARGQHIGRALYEYVERFAKETGCYNLTLNVWSCNESALHFYEKLGLLPQKIGMEKIL